MVLEQVELVEVLETGELFLGLKSEGDPSYEYVYRAAAGVRWDSSRHGFESAVMKDMSVPDWYSHILVAVKSELGVTLVLSKSVTWANVEEEAKTKVRACEAI